VVKKRLPGAGFAVLLSISLAGCELFTNSMASHFLNNTGVAKVTGVAETAEIRALASGTVLISPGDKTLTLLLSNPRNFMVRPELSVVTGNAGIITVSQSGPDTLELVITNPALNDEYDLTIAMQSPDGLRDFPSCAIPVRCVSFDTALHDLRVDIPGVGAAHPVQTGGGFTVSVPYGTPSVTLYAETEDPASRVGIFDYNNSSSLGYPYTTTAVYITPTLVLGANNFYVNVTAGVPKNYPVVIFLEPPSEITISAISDPDLPALTFSGVPALPQAGGTNVTIAISDLTADSWYIEITGPDSYPSYTANSFSLPSDPGFYNINVFAAVTIDGDQIVYSGSFGVVVK
jgi:hypothetical protein